MKQFAAGGFLSGTYESVGELKTMNETNLSDTIIASAGVLLRLRVKQELNKRVIFSQHRCWVHRARTLHVRRKFDTRAYTTHIHIHMQLHQLCPIKRKINACHLFRMYENAQRIKKSAHSLIIMRLSSVLAYIPVYNFAHRKHTPIISISLRVINL